MTKAEAQKKLDGLPLVPAQFCPLAQTNCVENCVCLVKKYLVGNSRLNSWSAHNAYCDNAMFSEV